MASTSNAGTSNVGTSNAGTSNMGTSNVGIVHLNVGGVSFQTLRSTLIAHKDSFLARLVSTDLNVLQLTDGAIFIDRDGALFAPILQYLRSGFLTIPPHLDANAVKMEFDFYLPGVFTIDEKLPLVERWNNFCKSDDVRNREYSRYNTFLHMLRSVGQSFSLPPRCNLASAHTVSLHWTCGMEVPADASCLTPFYHWVIAAMGISYSFETPTMSTREIEGYRLESRQMAHELMDMALFLVDLLLEDGFEISSYTSTSSRPRLNGPLDIGPFGEDWIFTHSPY